MPSYLQRAHDLGDHTIPPNLDVAIWDDVTDRRTRAVVVSPGFAYSGMKSHVLLTACREEESAGEDEGGGIFTRALLAALRTVPIDRTTYRGLMDLIPKIAE